MPKSNLSCLDATEQHFHILSQAPRSVTIDGRLISHSLPARLLSLSELRVLMLKRRIGDQAKTAVWSYLIRMSSAKPDPWVMAAAGMMLPGLKNIAAKLNPHYPFDARDLDAEILEAFLQELKLVDPEESAPHTRLYLAALRRGRQVCRRETRQATRHVPLPENVANACAGNPDVALARAVRDQVVTRVQADLISGVHLDSVSRGQAARQLRMSRDRVRRELATATRGLSAYLVGT